MIKITLLLLFKHFLRIQKKNAVIEANLFLAKTTKFIFYNLISKPDILKNC